METTRGHLGGLSCWRNVELGPGRAVIWPLIRTRINWLIHTFPLPFFSSSSDASMSMANMTYATSSPAATTGGQGSGPVSVKYMPYIKKLVIALEVLSLGSYLKSWRHSIRAPAFSLSLSTQISHNLIILFFFLTSIPS